MQALTCSWWPRCRRDTGLSGRNTPPRKSAKEGAKAKPRRHYLALDWVATKSGQCSNWPGTLLGSGPHLLVVAVLQQRNRAVWQKHATQEERNEGTKAKLETPALAKAQTGLHFAFEAPTCSWWPRSRRDTGLSGRNTPPRKSAKEGTKAKPRDRRQPQLDAPLTNTIRLISSATQMKACTDNI